MRRPRRTKMISVRWKAFNQIAVFKSTLKGDLQADFVLKVRLNPVELPFVRKIPKHQIDGRNSLLGKAVCFSDSGQGSSLKLTMEVNHESTSYHRKHFP